MRCPYCHDDHSKVLDTSHDGHGGIRRRRECLKCGQRFTSYERAILSSSQRDTMLEIAAGLKAGDVVASEQSIELADGVRVEPALEGDHGAAQ